MTEPDRLRKTKIEILIQVWIILGSLLKHFPFALSFGIFLGLCSQQTELWARIGAVVQSSHTE